MSIICMYCKCAMGKSEGTGESHGVCKKCLKEKSPGAYRSMRDKEAMRRGSGVDPLAQKDIEFKRSGQ